VTVRDLIEKLKEMPEYYNVAIYVDKKNVAIHDILHIYEVKISIRTTVFICGD
jgi:hypothetical protein